MSLHVVELRQRSKNGCQQCRRRKRKCDEQHPVCTGCIERRLPCNWERQDGHHKQLSRRRNKLNQGYTINQDMGCLTDVFAAPDSSRVQELITHFCMTSPLWLTVGGSERRDLSLRLIMSASRRSNLVLNCILAIAAGDLNKYRPASSDMGNLSLGFYNHAVELMRSELENEVLSRGTDASYNYADDTLLAIILLCVHEAVNFTHTDRILPHVNAAAMMCYNRSFVAAGDLQLRGLLFEIFFYFFSLIAFSHGHKLQLYLALDIFRSPFLGGIGYQGVLIGRGREIFYHILRISTLTAEISSPENITEGAKQELKRIEEQLSNLQIELPRGLTTTSGAFDDEGLTVELYRLACIIYLKKRLNMRLLNASVEIQTLLNRFVETLNTLPSTSPTNGILCWPLVIAGLSATLGSHRRLIARRLRLLNETWRSDILTKSEAFLLRTWKAAEGCDIGTLSFEYPAVFV